jgi:hypothetical protein
MKSRPKILFLNTSETDYLQDLTYSGLVRLLGRERVIDHPWNPHYHLPLKPYPKNLGYCGLAWPRLGDTLKDCDIIMVGAAKPRVFQCYIDIAERIPDSTPVIFLDGGDWPETGGDLKRLGGWELYRQAVEHRPFDLVFKREMCENISYPAKTFPLTFSFNFDRLPRHLPRELKYQVSFWAVESNRVRTRALELIENRFDCRANGTVRHQVFSKYRRKGRRYLEELAACSVVLNFPGAGWDTLRYWEVPALGRFMISQKPRIAIPHNFKEGQEVVFCRDDLSDLIELCQYYLDHPQEREAIARAAEAKAREKHSDEARAKYIMELMEKYLG